MEKIIMKGVWNITRDLFHKNQGHSTIFVTWLFWASSEIGLVPDEGSCLWYIFLGWKCGVRVTSYSAQYKTFNDIFFLLQIAAFVIEHLGVFENLHCHCRLFTYKIQLVQSNRKLKFDPTDQHWRQYIQTGKTNNISC